MEQINKKRVTSFLVIAALFHVVDSHACLRNEDCMYGGVCDTILRRCKCSLNCERFTNPNMVCAGKKYPMMECTALVLACEMQEEVPLTTFDLNLFQKTNNCKKMMTEPKGEFCIDQSFCSGNGICMRRIDNSQMFCRCVDNYTGDRCDIKQPALMPVTNSKDNTNGIIDRILNEDTVGSAGRMPQTDPVPYVTSAMIICAISACVAFYFRRRFVRSGITKKRDNEKSNIDHESPTNSIVSMTSENKTGNLHLKEKTEERRVKIAAKDNSEDIISEDHDIEKINVSDVVMTT